MVDFILAPRRINPPPPIRTICNADELLASSPGSLHFAVDDLPWQRSLRWTRRPRDRRLLVLGCVFAVLITALELAGFALGMKPLRMRRLPSVDNMIYVALIEPQPPPPAAPSEPEPPEIVRPANRISIDAPQAEKKIAPPQHAESNESNAPIGNAGVAAAQLFNPDALIRGSGLDAIAAPPTKPENPREAAQARWAEIEKRGNPLHCEKTRFAGAFEADEDLGDKVASKYLKWIGLVDTKAITHRRQQRAESGGCEPAE